MTPTTNRSAADTPDKLFELRFTPGRNWKEGLPMHQQRLQAHLERVLQAGHDGMLVAAGPYADGTGGLALLLAESDAAAERFVAEDPAVEAGVLACEVRCVVPVVGKSAIESTAAAVNERVLREVFDAVEKRDPRALAAYAGSVVIHEAESLPYGGDYVGEGGVLRHAEAYLEHWAHLQGEQERLLDAEFCSRGDLVTVLWRQRGRDAASSRSFDMPAMSAYRLEAGRIVDSRMFHFDATAVAAFLGSEPRPFETGERDAALNRRLQEGAFEAALEEFFAEDAEMAEVGAPPTCGKRANQARERVFFSSLGRIRATLLASAVHGDVSFSEWQYELVFKSGRGWSYHQVARRRWQGGYVVREDYFHADHPDWVEEEVRATALAAKEAARSPTRNGSSDSDEKGRG